MRLQTEYPTVALTGSHITYRIKIARLSKQIPEKPAGAIDTPRKLARRDVDEAINWSVGSSMRK